MFPLQVLVAGILGTGFMNATMWFIHRSGWANADMTRAVGSLVTRQYENSLGPGLLFHFAAGTAFAVPYLFIIGRSGFAEFAARVAVGGTIGIFHGAAMAFILMALVAERHPVERFRKAGADVAAAHVVGHVAYGLGVGLAAALF